MRNAIEPNAENVAVHGSDGSLGKQHILIHHTVNANRTALEQHQVRASRLVQSPDGNTLAVEEQRTQQARSTALDP